MIRNLIGYSEYSVQRSNFEFWDQLNQHKKRAECEKIHGYIKGTVKFDIRRVRNKSRKLYSLLSFISYQLLVLTEMQNKVEDKNSFGRYF